MGEIRIKSGNLANGELEQGDVTISGSIVSSAVRVRGYANVKPLTAYTIASNKPFRMCYGYNYDGVNLEKVGLIFDNNSGNNKLLTFTTPKRCNYIRFVMWNGDESNIVPTDIQNLILVEGTYTSETIPEYQPYFLNRPAHQVTNGQWVDIPTHHYTNNRWQGELTSQSPLKFRATGQSLLDWRIEGASGGVGERTENLFDGQLQQGYYTYHNGVYVLANSYVCTHLIPCTDNTTYTFRCINTGSGSKNYGYVFFDSTQNRIGDDYIDRFTEEDVVTHTATTPQNTAFLAINIAYGRHQGSVVRPSDITDFMLNTGSTALPYEPYGYKIPVTVNDATTTLYTDHQLMDGDSIDFTTDQTQIPITTGNNILTIDTAVQPSKVFVKFEG